MVDGNGGRSSGVTRGTDDIHSHWVWSGTAMGVGAVSGFEEFTPFLG